MIPASKNFFMYSGPSLYFKNLFSHRKVSKVLVKALLQNFGSTVNQGFSIFFVMRPRFKKDISTRPHYGHIYVNHIKALPSTANYMGNACFLRRMTSDSLLTTKQYKRTRMTKNVAIMINTEQKQTIYSK